MTNLFFIEALRAILATGFFLYLLRHTNRHFKGWALIVTGFALLCLGFFVDITDNFAQFNTLIEALLEKVVCYFGGVCFLMTGFLNATKR